MEVIFAQNPIPVKGSFHALATNGQNQWRMKKAR
jgi:hypothetical protein